MKHKTIRLISWIFLILFIFPCFLMLWRTVQNAIFPPKEPYIIDSPYYYEARYDEIQRESSTANIWIGYLCNTENGIKTSLYPYSHYNGIYTLPKSPQDSGLFCIKSIEYQWQFVDMNFEINSINFFSNQHWRTLYEENGKLYEQTTDSRWPFNRQTLICELLPEFGFYDPIVISGLDGCGILVLSSKDPGLEADIFVYIPSKGEWSKAAFLMPDGTKLEHAHGFVRRHVDLFSSSYVDNSAIGNMELCIKNKAGDYEICQVPYSDGVLTLTPNTDIEVSDEVWLNWTY